MIEVYTDGACRGNPGPGGWGIVVIEAGVEQHHSGYQPDTTNNQMELMAVLMALKIIPKPAVIKIYTDSQYVQKGMTTWIHQWQRRRWRTAKGDPVKNKALWQELQALADQHQQVIWQWVRGHAGDRGNELADRLANIAIEEHL